MKNDNNMTYSNIAIVLITNLIIFVMYIVTINNNLPMFFVFFAIERMMTFQYQEGVLDVLGNISSDEIDKKQLRLVVFITIAQGSLFIYAIFSCKELFVLLLVGELLDFVNSKIKKRFVGGK